MVHRHHQVQRIVHEELLIEAGVAEGRRSGGHHDQCQIGLPHLEELEALGGVRLDQPDGEMWMAVLQGYRGRGQELG